jgi:hypothetical protein
MRSIGTYVVRNLIALDQLLNTVLGGDPDETVSSRAAKARARGVTWGCVLCRALDAVHRDHCTRSLEYAEGRKFPGMKPEGFTP